jgi:hypothetical protein
LADLRLAGKLARLAIAAVPAWVAATKEVASVAAIEEVARVAVELAAVSMEDVAGASRASSLRRKET